MLFLHCSPEASPVASVPESAREVAIRLHVDVTAGTVGLVPQTTAPGLSFSLVGTDAVTLNTANLSRTALSSRRSLVRFDVAITNRVARTALGTPTFPAPPAGVNNVLLFPLE